MFEWWRRYVGGIWYYVDNIAIHYSYWKRASKKLTRNEYIRYSINYDEVNNE